MNRSRIPFAVAISSLLLAHSAGADTVSGTAFTSATVQVAGPRTGTSGTNFLNVEGSNNGNFASFGVVDFNVSVFNLAFPVTDVSNLAFSLTENNAAFTVANGGLNFYLTTDTTTSIAAGASPLKFLTASAPEGLGSQLATTYLLGSGTFSSNSGATGSGTVDTYSLLLSGASQSYFINQLNTANAVLRLIITPTDATGASTWNGGTNSTTSVRPKLAFNATLNQPTLTWVGGSGTWNATGGTDWSGGAWDSTKTAIFSTGSGAVTLGTPVTTLGMQFGVDGYTVAGNAANPLTLSSSAGGNAISVANSGDTATISAVIAGTTGLQKNGAGKLTLTGANTFTGDVTISSGTLAISSDANLGNAANGVVLNTGTLSAPTGATLGSTRTLSGSGSLDSTTGLTLTGPVNASALAITSGSTVTFSGNSIAFGSAALATGSHLNVTAPLTGGSRITISGDGTATLSGDNSLYGAGVSMSKGAGTVGPTVVINAGTSLGSNTLFLNAGTLSTSVDLAGANAISSPVSLGGSATLSGNMEVLVLGFFGSTAKRLTITDNVTLSGSITSTGTTNVGDALIKAGAGKLTLATSNNYTGGTQVLSGTLEVASGGALGTGDVLVAAENAVATVLRLDSNATIADLSNVFINNGAGMSQINLNFNSSLFETVNSLTVNGVPVTPGDYSAATLSTYLTGTGNLRVLATVPEPSVWALLLLGGSALAAIRMRRSPGSIA